ncbi:MAG TPA: LysM peptidoglycan-binding domain-containing protein [Candidatus Limnocylindrales bacterium]|nr:LysM peptidoglycan-binding domain-containing protein [Candidatus Limnocylindrales bacterium]
MTEPRRLPPDRRRSFLESPWIAMGLAVVVLAVAAALLLPGILSGGGIVATPTAGVAQASPTGPAPSPTFARPTPSPQPTFLSHVVRSGDTLNSIAREFRTTARSIAWWNRGAYPSLDPESGGYDPNRLEVGWRLRVLPDTVVDENNPPPPTT